MGPTTPMDELGGTSRLEPHVGGPVVSWPEAIRILCYNTRHCRGAFSPVVSEARVAAVVRALHPDIAGLTEIYRTERRDQPERLSRLTGTASLFHGVREVADGEYGNLLLSRLALRAVARVEFRGRGEDRGCLLAEVRFGDDLLTVALTHLGLDARSRREQIAEIARVLPRNRPLVVMGDFNGRLSELDPLRDVVNACPHPPRTYPSVLPVVPLDRVLFSRHFELRAAWTPFTLASDHRPLVVELGWTSKR